MLCLISSHAYMLQRWMLILSVAKISNEVDFFQFLSPYDVSRKGFTKNSKTCSAV